MNIFPIEEGEYRPCPIKSAQSQCDKHVVKMIVESGQMLSTVHRMLDGDVEMRRSKSGRSVVQGCAYESSVYSMVTRIIF